MKSLKHLSYFFLPLPPAGAPAVAEKKNQRTSIAIGHKECLAAGPYSQAAAEKILQVKWFFTHASVGSNMLDGLKDLHAADLQGYPLEFVTAERAPGAMRGGAIYEHNRGNPGWKSKFDRFEDCLEAGWHFPTVQVVMNKLCYIDQRASLKYYLHSMTHLETRFPDTILVYATIPLTTATDGDNFLRNAFNNGLRQWVEQKRRVLFDIADIEAHDREGRPATFQYRNKPCQRLCEKYTEDGGHLNQQGRSIVARGFYELSKALIESGRIK